MRVQQVYAIAYKCSNCDHSFWVEYEKGQKASEYRQCPRCETMSGVKLFEQPKLHSGFGL